MSIDLLDTPIRLTWDFPSVEACLCVEDLTGTGQRIADAGVFFVTLQGTPLQGPHLTGILEILSPCRVLVGCQGSPAELERLADLVGYDFELLLDVTGMAGEGTLAKDLPAVLKALRSVGREALPALTPLRQNLKIIPDLIRLCSAHGIAKIKLPNAHIGDSFHGYSREDLPRWHDIADFRQVWVDFAREHGPLPAMEIHDLFLWEIMTPGQAQNRSEYGGCQAGNSLGHVDSQGFLHPCAAWPHPLGRLPEQSLEDIWAGGERMTVRELIGRKPEGCVGCTDLGVCFGGCRGLAHHLNRNAGERDLMCPGPR